MYRWELWVLYRDGYVTIRVVTNICSRKAGKLGMDKFEKKKNLLNR